MASQHMSDCQKNILSFTGDLTGGKMRGSYKTYETEVSSTTHVAT